MSPHFLTRRVSRLLGLALVSCMGFRPCWCPSPFPSPSISQCFLFTLLHLPLDFIRLFFTVAVSAPHHQPSSLFQTWDWHYGNWISEKVEIPWWWSSTSSRNSCSIMRSIVYRKNKPCHPSGKNMICNLKKDRSWVHNLMKALRRLIHSTCTYYIIFSGLMHIT